MRRITFFIYRTIVCLVVLILAGGLNITTHAGDVAGASDAIISGCRDGLAEIELRSYKLTIDELQDAFYTARNKGALPWYVENSYSYVYTDTDGEKVISSLKPVYLDEEIYDRTLYEQAVAEALAETVYPGMSDLAIALSIHDYLAANCIYDDGHMFFTAYDALVRKSAVCQGYAEAYMDLLTRSGVPCMLVVSEEMDHTWNLVQIDGKWYHVDLTWDDPTEDRYGQVIHDYFLLSDGLISDEEHAHYGWDSDVVCDDISLDLVGFWRNIDSPIIYVDADTCFVRHDADNRSIAISRFDADTDTMTELYQGDGKGLSFNDDGYVWFYHHTGLSLWNDMLYFSDTEQVYAMCLDGSECKPVFSYNTEANDQYIAGSYVADAELYLTLSTHDKVLSQMIAALSDQEYHEHTYTPTVKAPSCKEDGYTTHLCSCGLSFTTDETSARGHSYGEAVVAVSATEDQPGTLSYTCLNCGAEKTEEIPQIKKNGLVETIIDMVMGLPEIIGGLLDGSHKLTKMELGMIGAILLVICFLFVRKRKR